MKYYLDKDDDVWRSADGEMLHCISCSAPNLEAPLEYVIQEYGPLRELIVGDIVESLQLVSVRSVLKVIADVRVSAIDADAALDTLVVALRGFIPAQRKACGLKEK